MGGAVLTPLHSQALLRTEHVSQVRHETQEKDTLAHTLAPLQMELCMFQMILEGQLKAVQKPSQDLFVFILI